MFFCFYFFCGRWFSIINMQVYLKQRSESIVDVRAHCVTPFHVYQNMP